MKRWLVSLDTDRVKEYVFATGRLKEIRGASALLDYLNRGKTPELLRDDQLIYTGGGSVMADFEDEAAANDFAGAVQALYPAETGAATITGVVIPYEDDPQKTEDFHREVKKAARALRLAKASGRRPALQPGRSLWLRCQRCGANPASHYQIEIRSAICDVCWTKQRQVQQSRHPFSPLERLTEAARQLEADQPEAQIRWPSEPTLYDELSQLAEASRPSGYIGFVYADGNGVGGIIEDELRRKSDFRVFSKILEPTFRTCFLPILELFVPLWR